MDKLSQLCDRLNDLIDAQLTQGHYKTGDEVVRAIALLLEERGKKLAALREAIEEGEASGLGEPFDLEEFLEEMHRSVERNEEENQPAAE